MQQNDNDHSKPKTHQSRSDRAERKVMSEGWQIFVCVIIFVALHLWLANSDFANFDQSLEYWGRVLLSINTYGFITFVFVVFLMGGELALNPGYVAQTRLLGHILPVLIFILFLLTMALVFSLIHAIDTATTVSQIRYEAADTNEFIWFLLILLIALATPVYIYKVRRLLRDQDGKDEED